MVKIKERDYLSTREAAKLLDVAVSTIQQWTDNGKLNAWTTVGGHRRINKNSVAKMLSQKNLTSAIKAHKQLMSVVIVTDDSDEQLFYIENFSNKYSNTNVCIVNDGYAGLMSVGKNLPDIIIADLIMPKMKGAELAAAVRQNKDLKNSLLILVSNLTEKGIKAQENLPSDVFVLKKPFSFDELDELIEDKFKINVA